MRLNLDAFSTFSNDCRRFGAVFRTFPMEVYHMCQFMTTPGSSMAVLTSSVFFSSPISWAYQASGSNRTVLPCSPYSHNPRVVCQSSFGTQEHNVSRRSIAIATGFAIVADAYSTHEAQAAKRKPGGAEEQKPKDDKDLSAYDAKVLATYRRKEAMKEALAKQKSRGKKIESDLSAEPVVKSGTEAPPIAESSKEAPPVLEAVAPAAE